MDIDFNNTVRVCAAGDQQSLVRFCEESGTIRSALGDIRLSNTGANVLFLRYEKLSCVYDLKRRAKETRLGGGPVIVETLADSAFLQERYRVLCMGSEGPLFSASVFSGSRRSVTPFGKENRLSLPNRPASIQANRFAAMSHRNLSFDGLGSTPHHSSPLQRVDSRTSRSLRSSGIKLSADESSISAATGLPSPLAKSPTVLRTNMRSSSLRISRDAVFTPRNSAARTTRSPLLTRTISLPRRPASSCTHYSASIRREATPRVDTQSRAELKCLKSELAEAKERYAQSLEKVRKHLDVMEQKHGA